MRQSVLVRYGAISEVARFTCDLSEPPARGQSVVVETDRGTEVGRLLDYVRAASQDGPTATTDDEEAPTTFRLVRPTTPDDEQTCDALRVSADAEFGEWCERIVGWQLNLELIDLEWTLGREKLILYVVNDRGPECTKLAIQASVAGLGPVHVQPVDDQGLVQVEQSGCGSGGCGSGGGGCSAH